MFALSAFQAEPWKWSTLQQSADTAQDLETNTCQERRWPPTLLKPQPAKGALGDRESMGAESCSKAYIEKLHMGFVSPGPFLVSSTQTARMTTESAGVTSPAAGRRAAGLGTHTAQPLTPSSNHLAITEQNQNSGGNQTALRQASCWEQWGSPCRGYLSPVSQGSHFNLFQIF